MKMYVCEELKLCVNSDCIQNIISDRKGEKHVEILKYSISVF